MSILRAQHVRAVGELARPHAAEAGRGSPRPSGRGTGSPCRARSSVPRYSRISSAVRSSTYALPALDQLLGELVQLLEVVARRSRARSPQSKPSQRTSSWMASTYSCSSVAGWCRRSAGCTRPPYSLRQAEVEADGLGVADVQVAVGSGGNRVWTRPAEAAAGHVPRQTFSLQKVPARCLAGGGVGLGRSLGRCGSRGEFSEIGTKETPGRWLGRPGLALPLAPAPGSAPSPPSDARRTVGLGGAHRPRLSRETRHVTVPAEGVPSKAGRSER